MSRRRDNAVFSLYTLVIVVVEVAWSGILAYWLLRLLRAFVPALRY
jgi:hypothetical protein